MSCALVVVGPRALNVQPLEALDSGRPYVHMKAQRFQRLALGCAEIAGVGPHLDQFVCETCIIKRKAPLRVRGQGSDIVFVLSYIRTYGGIISCPATGKCFVCMASWDAYLMYVLRTKYFSIIFSTCVRGAKILAYTRTKYLV